MRTMKPEGNDDHQSSWNEYRILTTFHRLGAGWPQTPLSARRMGRLFLWFGHDPLLCPECPVSKLPAGVDHGDNFVMVSRAPEDEQPEAIMGYRLKPGSDIDVVISNQRFSMFTQDNKAWLTNAEEDRSMVNAIGRQQNEAIGYIVERHTDPVQLFADGAHRHLGSQASFANRCRHSARSVTFVGAAYSLYQIAQPNRRNLTQARRS